MFLGMPATRRNGLSRTSLLRAVVSGAMAFGLVGTARSQDSTATWTLYSNEKHGFMMLYPPAMQVFDGERDQQRISALPHNVFYPCDRRDLVACFYLPWSFKGMRVEGAAVAIRLIQRFNTEAQCAGTPIRTTRLGTTTFVVLSPLVFRSAGHASRDDIYRTLRDEGCWELVVRLNTADADTLSNGTVPDQARLLTLLEHVRSTFRLVR
jgi:hypothetical protein